MAGYSINFHSCATNDSFYGEYFGNDNYNGGGGEQGFKGIYKQRLAHFQLCPTDTCGSSSTSCNDYVTDLGDFLYAYLQNKIAEEAVACENVKESCYCENAENEQVSGVVYFVRDRGREIRSKNVAITYIMCHAQLLLTPHRLLYSSPNRCACTVATKKLDLQPVTNKKVTTMEEGRTVNKLTLRMLSTAPSLKLVTKPWNTTVTSRICRIVTT